MGAESRSPADQHTVAEFDKRAQSLCQLGFICNSCCQVYSVRNGSQSLVDLVVLLDNKTLTCMSTMTAEDFFSVAEASGETTLSRQAIWKQIQSGALMAIKIGEQWVIPKREVIRLRRTRLAEFQKQVIALKALEK